MITEIKMGPTEKELDAAADAFAAVLVELEKVRSELNDARFLLEPARWAVLSEPRKTTPQERANQLHRQMCELMMRDDEMWADPTLTADEALIEVNAFISALAHVLGASLSAGRKSRGMSDEGARAIIERLCVVAGVPVIVGFTEPVGVKH